MIPHKFRRPLKDLVDELIKGNFAKLEADGRAGRLSAEDLKSVLTDYNRTFIPLPESEFDTMEMFPRVKSDGHTWGVDLDLFTEEEGRSDLTLQLTVRDAGEVIVTEIDDLHAL